MCSLFPIEAAAWRSSLERGNLVDGAAEMAWKAAAMPIVPNDDPFNRLMRECDGDFAELVRRLQANRNLLAWSNLFTDLLLDYHTRAHVLGQPGEPIQALARERAYSVMYISANAEADFVRGFLQDLMDGDARYWRQDGSVNEAEVLRRMRMYQGKMRGTAGWGLVDPQPPQTEIWWEIGATEDHCLDCPYNASVSPWSKETLYTTPGGGDTPCLFNCLCHLRIEDMVSAMPVLRAA